MGYQLAENPMQYCVRGRPSVPGRGAMHARTQLTQHTLAPTLTTSFPPWTPVLPPAPVI